MNPFLEFLGAWLADFYLFSTLLLAAALGTITFMHQPTRKLAVIRATIIALFLLAALCALPNWSSVHLTESSSYSSSSSSSASPTTPRPKESYPYANSPTAESTPPSPPAPDIARNSSATNSFNPATLLTWLFLTGTFLAASWLSLGAWHLARLSRESETAPQNFLVLLETITGPEPVSMLPRLRIAARLPSAVATGIWESTILLPRSLAENADPDELGTVLAHEWAHVKNGDLRLLAAVRVLMLLLWAHPLYWLLRRRVRLEQELLADAAAAEHTNRRDYAAQLVDWARNLPAAPHASLASSVGIWEGPSQLKRRISLLLDDTVTLHRRCSRAWQLTAGSLGALAALVLSLLTLRPETAMAETETGPANTDTAEATSDAKPRDTLAEIHGNSTDYQKILGHWKVDSVKGTGGSFMDIDEKTQPGDVITIPHVRAPGPEYEGRSKIYQKDPNITLWMSPAARKDWTRDDSLHLYPEADPPRATYKAEGGDKGHFDDPESPPEFTIYRFDDDGDTLTLLIGDPKDFKVNEGKDTTITSAGTKARWTWRIVIPNYPKDFEFDPGKHQLLVTLKRVPR